MMVAGEISTHQRRPNDLDDYDVELEDIFQEPNVSSVSEVLGTRNEREGLGLEDAVSVTKRARIPRVKLDDQRLLSETGIPRLRNRARKLRLKGKGHEFSDAARILSLYQLWLDDLFPKAKFLDALSMVEKAGHKTVLLKQRREWIEGEIRSMLAETDDQLVVSTPPIDVVLAGDDDDPDGIYTATPRRPSHEGATGSAPHPDEDDMLESLMLEAADTTSSKAVVDPEADMFADEEAVMAQMDDDLW